MFMSSPSGHEGSTATQRLPKRDLSERLNGEVAFEGQVPRLEKSRPRRGAQRRLNYRTITFQRQASLYSEERPKLSL